MLIAYITLIAVTLLACGFLAGWLARGDRNADIRLDRVEVAVRGRHAQSRPRRLPASTGELAALYTVPEWQSSKESYADHV